MMRLHRGGPSAHANRPPSQDSSDRTHHTSTSSSHSSDERRHAWSEEKELFPPPNLSDASPSTMSGAPDMPPPRAKLQAEEEAEFNVLLRALLLTAQDRQVTQLSATLLAAFSANPSSEASFAAYTEGTRAATEEPWFFPIPYADVFSSEDDEDDDCTTRNEEDGTRDTFTVVLPKLRQLKLDTYLGPQQLHCLADVLAPTIPRQKSKEKTHIPPFSLLPYLEELRLVGLTARFDTASNGAGVFSESDEAYMALLRNLRGHPRLRSLVLRGSRVGPLLLPDLQRLIKETPSLCEVDVSETRMSASEAEMLRAQCLLNHLRKEKRPLTELPSAVWEEALRQWLQSQAVAIMASPLAPGAERPGQGSRVAQRSVATPYVMTACTEAEMEDLQYALYGKRRATHALTSSKEGRRQGALEATPSERKLPGDETTDGGQPSMVIGSCTKNRFPRRSEVSDSTDGLLSSRADDAAADEEWGDLQEDDEASRPNASLRLPYLHYRQSADDTHVLSRGCVEVIRAAFVNPAVATQTFLGGRRVPEGVPGPLKTLGSTSSDQRQALKQAMSNSALLTAVRRTLFPALSKPASVFGPSFHDPSLRTTAEENYYAKLAQQDAQWNLILDKLVDHARPAYFTPENGTQACVYEYGSTPYWLSFLPPRKAHDPSGSVCVYLPDHEHPEGGISWTVGEGEFFGEVELLGGEACHTDATAVLQADLTTRRLMGGRLNPTLVVRQLQKARNGSAYVTSGEAENQRPTSVLLWQIPLEVAVFFLQEPYAQWQTQLARSMRLARMGGERSIPPALCPTVASLMEAHEIVRRHSPQVGRHTDTGSCAEATPAKESDVIAEGEELQTTLFFLQAGEYTLCSFTVNGKWMEHPLLPGNVLLGREAFHLDAAARGELLQKAKGAAGSNAASAVGGLTSQAMGKEAALRQYREAKRRARLATAEQQYSASATSPSVMGSQAAAAADTPAAGPSASASGEQMLCIGRTGASAVGGTWRYYTMSFARFARLPEQARLALTMNSVLVEEMA